MPLQVLFQSTFPRGERLSTAILTQHPRDFNPRSRVGNDLSDSIYRQLYRHFNPRSRVGNDDTAKATKKANKISIHVPAWGTTRTATADCTDPGISIHVPEWGTTSVMDLQITQPIDFNPRSRVGNDRAVLLVSRPAFRFQSTFPRGERHSYALTPAQAIEISIHVPAWGTTNY